MINKLNMMTKNKADENFYKLAALFPNAVTETIDENGEVVRAIDKDILMQEISFPIRSIHKKYPSRTYVYSEPI